MKNILILGSTLCLAAPAMAQEKDEIVLTHRIRDDLITVVATGLSEPAFDIGQSISIVGRDEIEAVQGPDLARVLERLPGVTLARNGGLGGFTGLFVRGANSQQVLVLVDGIRVADVAAPGGGYDFGNLVTGSVDKIELLRGSNSVAWGSDAIGGVLAITSRRLDGVEASAEYGARDTLDGNLSAGIERTRYDFTLSGGYTETDGFSQAAVGSEPDGFRQWRASGRGRFWLTETLSVVAAGRYADSRLDFDGFSNDPPYGLVDTPEFTRTEEVSGRAGLAYGGEALALEGAYAIYDIDRANFDPRFGLEPSFASQGRQERVEMRGRWHPLAGLRLDFGADREWSGFDTNFDEPARARLASGHALLGWHGEGFAIAAGARIDDHSRFGSAWTFGANGSVDIAGDWRVRASYGEGFKAPTLYQLFSDFGNPALAPESSTSYDIGIEKGDRNAYLPHIAITAFRRNTRGLIDFVSCFSASNPLCDDGRFGFYANVGKARAQGIEVELGAQITERFRAQAAYTYLEAENRSAGDPDFGKALARRPRHAITVAADWLTPLHDLEVGGDIRMVGDSFDDAGNFTRIDGHAVATLRARMPLGDRLELFGRIENIGDARYQTVAGYGTAGRSAYVGARARF